MKSKFILAAVLCLSSLAAFAQTSDPAKTLKEINDFQETQLRTNVKSPADLSALNATVKAKALDAIKGVDITKVDPKAALSWAKLFSIAKDHQSTCMLAQRYLTSNPSDSDRFDAQMLMMESCNSLGEGKMIEATLKQTKPATPDQDEDFMEYSVYELSDTIAAVEGPKAAYNALVNAETKLVPIKGSNEAEAADQTAGLHYGFKTKEAEFLARSGDKPAGLKLLDDFGKTLPAKSPVVDELAYGRNGISTFMSPAVELNTVKTFGDFKSLSDLKGKVVILDFFAHWCPPCRAAFPDEAKMYADLKDKGLEMVGVTQYYHFFKRENREKRDMPVEVELAHMTDFVKEYNLTWPVLIGDESNFKAYGVIGIPHVVIIDRKGIVRDMEVGYDSDSFPAFRAKVEALLAEQ